MKIYPVLNSAMRRGNKLLKGSMPVEESRVDKDFRWIIFAIVAVCAIFILVVACKAEAEDDYDLRAEKAIIGEAENQGEHGMLAVACAIRNRGTLDGVYGENNPRVLKHKYSDRIAIIATFVWVESDTPENCSFINGATHWENVTVFDKPMWAKMMTEAYRYRDHVFYKAL